MSPTVSGVLAALRRVLTDRHADVDAVDVMTLPIAAPACERCGALLQLKRHRGTGETFYGCSRAPRCGYTRPL